MKHMWPDKTQIHIQLDVKSAFLNEPLEEEQMYKLKKAYYGLKQDPRAWNKRTNSFLLQLNFTKCSIEHEVNVRMQNGGADLLLICL